MLRQGLKYGVGLTALYLIVANASGFGQVFSSGAEGTSKLVRTFQGR